VNGVGCDVVVYILVILLVFRMVLMLVFAVISVAIVVTDVS